MSKIRIKNVQTAQGMVEFALVLPILLLVVLGVFAFGHMFFVYSSVVSASREAARWGAAVGTAGGAGGLPRYQDCGAIIASAVRVGAFAGVGPSSVAIDYDSGPGTPVNPSGNCPSGGSGPDVGLGDRIIVTVTVMYKPIVPFIDLPTFPLTATSARTIIKSLPVGEAPTAKPLWPSTTTEISPASSTDAPIEVVVGQTLTLTVKVWDENGLSPTGGKVYVNDELGNNCNPNPLTPKKDGVTCTFQWSSVTAAGTVHEISARYEPEGAQFINSSTLGYVKVNPAPTTETITSPSLTPSGTGTFWAAPIVYRDRLDLTFKVNVAAPGVQMVTPLKGTVRVDDNGSTIYSISNYTVGDVLTRSLTPTTGAHTISVTFEGTSDYAASTSSFTIEVFNQPPTPTFTPLPTDVTLTVIPPADATATPNVTPLPTSAATALPAYCPSIVSGSASFTAYSNSLYFAIQNPPSNGSVKGNDSTIDQLQVIWPSQYNVILNQVMFGGAVASCDTSSNCLLYNLASMPTTATFTSGFNSAASKLPAYNNTTTTYYMRLFFNGALPSGSYTVIVHFSDANNRNCQVQLNVTH